MNQNGLYCLNSYVLDRSIKNLDYCHSVILMRFRPLRDNVVMITQGLNRYVTVLVRDEGTREQAQNK